MSPEVVDSNLEQLAGSRFTNEELLEARLEAVQEQVLPAMIESPEFADYSNWQQETVLRMQANLAPDQVVDLPTRTGKSDLIRKIAHVCQQQGLISLIVAPRRHILVEHKARVEKMGSATRHMDLKDPEFNGLGAVNILSTQAIAKRSEADIPMADQVDQVLIDEGHRALGPKTVAALRRLFPNAVRTVFTATPDFASNRSVTDEYGEKIISHSIIEAIKEAKVPPVRAFLYKTKAVIDYLDPSNPEFTPRELKRLSQFAARNTAIIDMAQDLVQQGRQGLITTIPGENLLHADRLASGMSARQIKLPNGETRPMRVRVLRGEDKDVEEALSDYEAGFYDVLLYCDLLREGFSTDVASFLINGRPRTSIVSLTQDIGRVLNPKEGEMIIIDFLDESVKRQCTAYDVLELNRVTQAVSVASQGTQVPSTRIPRDTYMRGLFRPDLVEQFEQYDNVLLSELHYTSEPVSPYERRRIKFESDRARELVVQTKIWEKTLAKKGLAANLPDYFAVRGGNYDAKQLVDEEDPSQGYWLENTGSLADSSPLITYPTMIVPTVSMPNEQIDEIHQAPPFEVLPTLEEEAILEEFLPEDIWSAMSPLDERERAVIQLFFGLTDGVQRTQKDVGRQLGVTVARVHQVLYKALAKLRHPNYGGEDLRNYIVDDYQKKVAVTWRSADELVAEEKRKLTAQILDEQAPAVSQQQKNEAAKKYMADRDHYFNKGLKAAIMPILQFKSMDPDQVESAHKFVVRFTQRLGIGRFDYPAILKVLETSQALDLGQSLKAAYKLHRNAVSYRGHSYDERTAAHHSCNIRLDAIANAYRFGGFQQS